MVIPENAGRADVTQNWLAPCTNVAPPIWVTRPDEAKTSEVLHTIEKINTKRKIAITLI